MLRLPELYRDAEGRHRKHAAPLHSGSRRGPRDLTAPFDRSGGKRPPLILAIETSGAACSAALARGDEVVAAERRAMRHGHGEALMPMIAALALDLLPHDIDIVAASVGPGGFTGIRVGLAAAHGIALAAGARTMGVTTFAAIAAGLAGRHKTKPVLAAVDSRRSDLYVQLIGADGIAMAPPAALAVGDLSRYVAELVGERPLLIAGDAAGPAAAGLQGRGEVDIAADSGADALGVLAACRAIWRGRAKPEPLAPLYLHPPGVSLPKRGPATSARPR